MRNNPTGVTRRTSLVGLASVLASPMIGSARAQDAWPTKPVRLIIPYAPGGAGDAVARAWAEQLSRATTVPFVVENQIGRAHV